MLSLIYQLSGGVMIKSGCTRRKVLQLAMGLGLKGSLGVVGSAASVASTYADLIQSDSALSLAMEKEKEAYARAKYEFRFASPYYSSDWPTNPHMHQQIKQQIEAFSNGEIVVTIVEAGVAGIGPSLMKRVSHGYISGALISASNLSPVAPVLDVLNIPFWSADNQSYLNLITSRIWQVEVESRIKRRGLLEVMFPYVVGPRTLTSTRLYNNTIAKPADLSGVVIRIPTSKVLSNFYRIVQAKTLEIPWGEASAAASKGLFQVLDPSIVGLYNGPGSLRRYLGTICQINSVQDSWLAVINQQWLARLPKYLQQAMRDACQQVFQQQVSGITTITNNCLLGLKEAGVNLYSPSSEEKALWQSCCGHQHDSWRAIKFSILKDHHLFAKLLEATQVNNGYTL